MTAPQRPASNSDARKRAEERAAENGTPCPECELVGLCADCCEDGAFSDPVIHRLLAPGSDES